MSNRNFGGGGELRQATSANALVKQIVLAVGILIGIGMLITDFYLSVIPLSPYIGDWIAWGLSIFSSPVEMMAGIYIFEMQYRNLLSKPELAAIIVIGGAFYVFDIASNIDGLLQFGSNDTIFGTILCVSVGFGLAFVEHLISWMVTLVVGKSVVSGMLNLPFAGGRPAGYDQHGNKIGQDNRHGGGRNQQQGQRKQQQQGQRRDERQGTDRSRAIDDEMARVLLGERNNYAGPVRDAGGIGGGNRLRGGQIPRDLADLPPELQDMLLQ